MTGCLQFTLRWFRKCTQQVLHSRFIQRHFTVTLMRCLLISISLFYVVFAESLSGHPQAPFCDARCSPSVAPMALDHFQGPG